MLHQNLSDWYAPSGSYAISVGHASDDIRLTATISFTTEKLLPLNVTTATTVSELMTDPRTAARAKEVIAAVMEGGTLDRNDPATAAMMAETMKAMPLKSLPCFGMLSGDRIDKLVEEMKQLADG